MSFRISRLRSCSRVSGRAKDFIPLSTYSNPARKWPRPASSAIGTTNWHKKSERPWRSMRPSRILSPCSAWNSFPRKTVTPSLAPDGWNAFSQPFFTTEQFSGIKGKLVSLKDSLDGCERILQDEFKDYPESALYMIGAIDEAKKKTKTEPKPKPEVKHA